MSVNVNLRDNHVPSSVLYKKKTKTEKILSYVQVQLMASYSISQGMRQMAFVKLSLEVEEGAVIIN